MNDGFYTISPYDGRYCDVGQKLSPWFSEAGLIRTRVALEISYVTFLSHRKIIRPFTSTEKTVAKKITLIDDKAISRIKEIEAVTHHDVQAVTVYIREVLSKTSLADIADFVHFGLTSEDINNLAWRIALVKARDMVLVPSLARLIDKLSKLAEVYKSLPMLGRTHGQPAIPTTLGKEIINVAVRLFEQKNKIAQFQFQGKLNGAVGNFNAPSYIYPMVDWIRLSDAYVISLGFVPNHFTTQVHPNDDIIEYLQIIERVNTITHGFAQDMWRYISDNLVVLKPVGVGSSTMPQKMNPIDFEHSEGATEIANGLISVLVARLGESRLQRDLSDTLLLRFLGEIHAATIDAQQRVSYALSRAGANREAMREMLEKNWAILSEPLQLLLRKSHIKHAYDVVKKHTQGKFFTQREWNDTVNVMIDELGVHDTRLLAEIRKLTPAIYLGKAVRLTEEGLRLIHT